MKRHWGRMIAFAFVVSSSPWSGCSSRLVGPVGADQNFAEWRQHMSTPQGVGEWMRAAMDLAADPCADFYQYACGGTRRTPLANGLGGVDLAAVGSRVRLWQTIDQLAERPGSGQMRDFVDSCVEEKAPRLRLSGAMAVLGLQRPVTDLNGFLRNLGILHRHYVDALFVPDLGLDPTTGAAVLELRQGGLGLYPQIYTRDDQLMRDIQRNYMLGLRSDEVSRDQAEAILGLESALAGASAPDYAIVVDEPITIAELEKFTQLPWQAYLDGLGALQITRVRLATETYFGALGAHLRTLSPQTLDAYVSAAFERETALLWDQRINRRPWNVCVNATQDAFPHELSSTGGGEAQQQATNEAAQRLWDAIQSAAAEQVATAAWIGSDRLAFGSKMKKVQPILGYPLPLQWTPSLPVGSVFFANTMAARRAWRDRMMASIGTHPSAIDFAGPPAGTLPGYMPVPNAVMLPAWVLDLPVFSPQSPPETRFGGLGYVMGHEIGHTIDRYSRNLDSVGKSAALAPTTRAALDRQQQCLSRHFASFEAVPRFYSRVIGGHVPEAPVDAEQTLDEALADLVGIRAAYSAYRGARDRAARPLIEGVSNDRAFFVAVAQNWCGERNDYAKHVISTFDVHMLPRARVNASLAATPEFAEVFQCAAGTRMNPRQRCDLL